MNKLTDHLERYVGETLGISPVVQPWEEGSRLPQYLRESYQFFRLEMLDLTFILIVDTREEEQSPAIVGKHLDQVRLRGKKEVVYVRQAVASYNRKRLIEQKIPFIIPGNQLYLPMLGMDLREHLKRLRKKKWVFSPSTQALILYVLWRNKADTMTPADIAHRLGYSAMTMTRAFDELETAGIGELSVVGKERHLRLREPKKLLWERALPYLKTPVRKRLYVPSTFKTSHGCVAGESALASYTLMAEPKNPILAFSVDDWRNRMEHGKIVELSTREPDAFEIELWKYAPASFANEGKVDRLSLYLSLKEYTDERVQAALDALLGGMKW